MNKLLSILAIGILTVSLTACTKPKPNADLNKPTPPTSNQNSTTDTTEQDEDMEDGDESSTSSDSSDRNSMITKMNYYVDCVNSQSRVMQSYNRYLSWVDEKKGPTGKEMNIYGLYTLNSPEDCLKDLEVAKKASPTLEILEKAGEDYRIALSEVDPIINEANDYYEQGNYKDDNMTKGKELHPKLMAAFEKFKKADTTLRAEIDKIQSANEAKELAELEKKEGRKIPFLTKNSLASSKKVLAEGQKDMKSINVDTFKKTIDEYEKTVKELSDYVSRNKSEASRSGSSVNVDFYISSSKEFLKSAKELMRRVRDKVEFDTGERMLINSGHEEMVEGTPGKLIQDYNDLVNRYNSLATFGL